MDNTKVEKVVHYVPLGEGTTKMYCTAINTTSFNDNGNAVHSERFTVTTHEVTCPLCKERLNSK